MILRNINDFELRKKLYDNLYADPIIWLGLEFTRNPPEMYVKDPSEQKNALLNFITLDLHTLQTTEGYNHAMQLLMARETDQQCMLRLKDLVYDSRLTYGDKNIEFMMNESLKMMKYTYGLTVDLEPLNANDTLWLHPFLRKVYTQYGFGVINQVTFMTGQSAGLMAPPQPKEEK